MRKLGFRELKHLAQSDVGSWQALREWDAGGTVIDRLVWKWADGEDPDIGLGEGSGGESTWQEALGWPGLAERRLQSQAKLGSDPCSAITLAE